MGGGKSLYLQKCLRIYKNCRDGSIVTCKITKKNVSLLNKTNKERNEYR